MLNVESLKFKVESVITNSQVSIRAGIYPTDKRYLKNIKKQGFHTLIRLFRGMKTEKFGVVC
jgi:hypothetical protein